MESLITKLKTPSPHHEVEMALNGFVITPRDSSEGALDDFQPIVEEALHYAGDDYQVVAVPITDAVGKYARVYFNQVTGT
ncbi:hypothetical protein LG202_16020 [Methylobacillus methanolivorans]